MTDADQIKHLWTHKTQDHPSWSDEDLMIERGEGVYVWNRRGRRLFDAYAGLAVVNVGHGRAEIADAVREQGPIVGAVRSRGLMVAIDFADPADRHRPLDRNRVASLNTRALDKGYIAMAKDSVLRLAPPLCINAAEVDELAQLVGDTVRELQDEVTRSTRGKVAAA